VFYKVCFRESWRQVEESLDAKHFWDCRFEIVKAFDAAQIKDLFLFGIGQRQVTHGKNLAV
jgi:hypothetical protein